MLSGPEETGGWYGGGGREGGGTGPPLEELRLAKFGCNLRTSRVAAGLGWTGAVLRWESILTIKLTNYSVDIPVFSLCALRIFSFSDPT